MLYKRYKRDIRRNFGMYFAIFLILAVGLGTVLGGNSGDDSMIQTVEDFYSGARLCDGSASMLFPLTDEYLDAYKDRYETEAAFYADLDTDCGTLRVFQNRDTICLPYVRDGRLPESTGDIFLEKHFADANGYSAGDSLTVGGERYTVCGTGCLPDYNYILKRIGDMSSHTGSFSVALVNADAFETIRQTHSGRTIAHYLFLMREKGTAEGAKQFFSDAEMNLCTEFLIADTDPRVTTYKEDCAVVKRSTFIFAVILMIVISYVMCVFLQNRIERERKYIGTLSALGYRKHELILHYLGLPVLISEAGGLGALVCGYFIFSKMLTKDSTDLYSIPDFSVRMPAYIIAFGIAVPPLIMLLIGFFMLSKKIAATPNAIMYPKQKYRSSRLILRSFSYITRFRLRQFGKELTGNLVMIVGIFVSAVLLLLGYSIYSSVRLYQNEIDGAVRYQHLYYVNGAGDVPADAEKADIRMLKYSTDSGKLDVTMFGIQEESAYFDAGVTAQGIKNGCCHAVISDAFAEKCGVRTHDEFELTDSSGTETYRLYADAVIPYSVGLHVFIHIDDAAELLGQDAGMYNALLSSRELDSDEIGALAEVTSEEYREAADSMLQSLMLIIAALLGSAAVIFVMVLYLMLKFMTDKAKGNISLLKILGYHANEVNKIYLGGETQIVILAVLLSLPSGTLVIRGLFPYLTAGYSVCLRPGLTLTDYAVLALFMFAAYCAVYLYLRLQLKRVSFADTLKERE